MCSTNDALRKLIDDSLGENLADLTFTGWKSGDESDPYSHQGSAEQNTFITQNGVNAGGVVISQGSNMNRGGGYFGPKPEAKPLTVETVRGILVTALAVSLTKRGQSMASGFAKILESLATNCFHPVRYDLRIHGNTDPYIQIEVSNGMQTVVMATADSPFVGDLKDFKLDIPNRYHLGTGVAEILAGSDHTGYGRYGFSPTGIQVEIDGKWKRAMGLSAHKLRDEEKTEKSETVSLPALTAIFGDTDAGKLSLTLASSVLEQLTKVYGGVELKRVDMTQYDRERKGSIRLEYQDLAGTQTFGLDFERE